MRGIRNNEFRLGNGYTVTQLPSQAVVKCLIVAKRGWSNTLRHLIFPLNFKVENNNVTGRWIGQSKPSFHCSVYCNYLPWETAAAALCLLLIHQYNGCSNCCQLQDIKIDKQLQLAGPIADSICDTTKTRHVTRDSKGQLLNVELSPLILSSACVQKSIFRIPVLEA